MSLDEFRLWQQFDAESPLPDLRSDIQTAHLVTSVVNMSGRAVKSPMKLEDALLFRKRPEGAQRDVLDTLTKKFHAKARD